jgi:hypothetical protein
MSINQSLPIFKFWATNSPFLNTRIFQDLKQGPVEVFAPCFSRASFSKNVDFQDMVRTNPMLQKIMF